MGIADWFNFETAKQKKKRMDRYYKKLYPFGKALQISQTRIFMMKMKSARVWKR